MADPSHLEAVMRTIKTIDAVYDAYRVVPAAGAELELNLDEPNSTSRISTRGTSAVPVASPDVPEFQTSPGTRDILSPDSTRFRALVAVFASVVAPAGYGEIVTPMFEDLGVFQRLGESTDVVTKEMYDFVDKGGRHIALRPEQTAGIVRAFVQHSPADAVEGLVRRTELPLREAAARPVPAVRSGRHRGARCRRPVRRCRGRRTGVPVLRATRAAQGHPPAEQPRESR